MSQQVVDIALVSHDVVKRRSLVLLTWPNDPERRLSLPIPYTTSLDDIQAAAEEALRALSSELADIRIAKPAG